MGTKLFSPPLSCPWVTSRDVIKGFLPRRRRECVTTNRKNRVAAVSAMIVEPLSAVSSSAIQIHQWWEQNPNSVLLMAETGGGYSLASYYTSLGLFVISVPGLWSLIKRSVKSKVRTFSNYKTLKFHPQFLKSRSFRLCERRSLLAKEKESRRNQSKLLERFSLSSQGRISTLLIEEKQSRKLITNRNSNFFHMGFSFNY